MHTRIEEAVTHQHCILEVGPGIDGIRVFDPIPPFDEPETVDPRLIRFIQQVTIRDFDGAGHATVRLTIAPPNTDPFEIEFRSATCILVGGCYNVPDETFALLEQEPTDA